MNISEHANYATPTGNIISEESSVVPNKIIHYFYQLSSDKESSIASYNATIGYLKKLDIDGSIEIKPFNLDNYKTDTLRSVLNNTLGQKHLIIFMLNKTDKFDYTCLNDIEIENKSISKNFNLGKILKDIKSDSLKATTLICMQNGDYKNKTKLLETEQTENLAGNLNLLFSNSEYYTLINSLGIGYVLYPTGEANLFIRGLVDVMNETKNTDLINLVYSAQSKHNEYYLRTFLSEYNIINLRHNYHNEPEKIKEFKRIIKRLFTYNQYSNNEPIPFGLTTSKDSSFYEANAIHKYQLAIKEGLSDAIYKTFFACRNNNQLTKKSLDTLIIPIFKNITDSNFQINYIDPNKQLRKMSDSIFFRTEFFSTAISKSENNKEFIIPLDSIRFFDNKLISICIQITESNKH